MQPVRVPDLLSLRLDLFRLVLALLAALLLIPSAFSHSTISKIQETQGLPLQRSHRVAIGATGVFLNGVHSRAGTPALVSIVPQLATLQFGDALDCWTLRDPNRVQPIPENQFREVEDHTGISRDEPDAFEQCIVAAHLTNHSAFLRAGRRDLLYGHLFHHPRDHRGQVVRLQGELRRVVRVDPPPTAAAAGVQDLYIGYVFQKEIGPRPWRVLITEWPTNLPRALLGAKIKSPVQVEFAGYFYKVYRYQAADRTRPTRDAPMLIGHSLTVIEPEATPPEEAEPAQWPHSLSLMVLGVTFGGFVQVVGLGFWFRRADDKVRRRLRNNRPDPFFPAGEGFPRASGGVGYYLKRVLSRIEFVARAHLPTNNGPAHRQPGSGDGMKENSRAGPDGDAGA